jgi:hypothetical protein
VLRRVVGRALMGIVLNWCPSMGICSTGDCSFTPASCSNLHCARLKHQSSFDLLISVAIEVLRVTFSEQFVREEIAPWPHKRVSREGVKSRSLPPIK